MKQYLFAAAVLTSTHALAQEAPKQADPTMMALSQMVQQCTAREAQALAGGYAAQAQITALTEKLAAEKKRADDAEAKLPKLNVPK